MLLLKFAFMAAHLLGIIWYSHQKEWSWAYEMLVNEREAEIFRDYREPVLRISNKHGQFQTVWGLCLSYINRQGWMNTCLK